MSRGSYIVGQVMQYVSYLVLQLILAQSVTATTYAQCFIYVGIFLLVFSQRANLTLQLTSAFILGLIMDAFYNTLGIHAFASVLLVYLKSILIKLILPARGYFTIKPSLNSLGFIKFSVFILICLLTHHGAVFALEAWNSRLFLLAIQKTLLSTLFTYLWICAMQILSILVVNNKL
jgi:hypothetical protein